MDVRQTSGDLQYSGRKNDSQLLHHEAQLLFQLFGQTEQEVEIDLDEVLDIEEDLERKVFIKVFIINTNYLVTRHQ